MNGVSHTTLQKRDYYWRLRKVREAYLETAEQTQTFVEVPSPAIHPVNMTSEHNQLLVIRKSGKQPYFGNHGTGICLISKNIFGSGQQCSMMAPGSQKCIWQQAYGSSQRN